MKTLKETESLFAAIVGAGIPYDSHESDLYLPDSEPVRTILARFPLEQSNARRFKSDIPGQGIWLDVPFAFLPFWENKARGLTNPVTP